MAAAPTATRLSLAAVVAGAGGAVLVLSLFLPFYSAGGFSQSGWESASFIDIVLFVIGVLAIGYAFLEFTGRRVGLPFGLPRTVQVMGIVATTITWAAIVENSHQGFGLILAGLASLAILAGGVLAERAPGRMVALGGAQPGGGAVGAPGGAPVAGGYVQPPGGYTAQPPGVAQPAAAPAPASPPAAGAQATAIGGPSPAASEPPPPTGGKADWYPDPRGEKRLRYYDGSQWTQHVAD